MRLVRSWQVMVATITRQEAGSNHIEEGKALDEKWHWRTDSMGPDFEFL
jgi:hypothetical protein